MDPIPAGIFIDLARSIGVPAVIIVMGIVFFLLRRADERRLEQDIAREQERAAEHRKKWDDMIKMHEEEQERQFKLFERQTEVQELHARLLIKIESKLNEKTICPLATQKGDAG
jgi:hypothetical protein